MAIKFLNTVAVDTSVLYVNAANNRVGINTISPSSTLSVGDGTEDSAIAVSYSDGSYTRINGYGLYMSRGSSYIRPTTTTTQTLFMGNVSRIWSAISNNANTHYFVTGANEHMRILSNGRIGIGVTSPASKFEVYGGISGVDDVDRYVRFKASNGEKRFDFHIGGTENASRLDMYSSDGTSKKVQIESEGTSYLNGGNVGIGTTSPSDTLEVEGGVTITSATPTKLLLNNTKNGTWTQGEALGLLEFYGNDTSGGGAKVQSSIDIVAQDQYGAHFNMLFKLSKGSTGNLEVMKLTGEGDLYMTDGTVTATNFITSSDERLKENIKEAFGDKVEVNWKTFELKTDKGHKRYGVIAQDLEKNHPEFVKTDNEGMKSVAYTDLLIAKIAELENRIQALENK